MFLMGYKYGYIYFYHIYLCGKEAGRDGVLHKFSMILTEKWSTQMYPFLPSFLFSDKWIDGISWGDISHCILFSHIYFIYRKSGTFIWGNLILKHRKQSI